LEREGVGEEVLEEEREGKGGEEEFGVPLHREGTTEEVEEVEK
jgi:hypothetical protein